MDPAERKDTISRRRMLKRIGAGAVVAWSAPILTSLRDLAFAASEPIGCTATPCYPGCAACVYCGPRGADCCCMRQPMTGECLCMNADCGVRECSSDADCIDVGRMYRCVIVGTCCHPSGQGCLRLCDRH